jgi:ABC-type Na+ efflux pump permease subunit
MIIGQYLADGFLWQILKELASGIKERSLSSFSPILWAFVITFIILLLSGKVRGEAARMWLFLTPMVIIPASIAFDEFGIWEHKEWLGIIIALQGLNNLILREFLRVWGI